MEAVRIRRRGGEGRILNSKAEFNRSYIPRLVVDKEEEERVTMARKADKEDTCKELDKEEEEWWTKKTDMRDRGERKRTPDDDHVWGRRKKRRKLQFHTLGENWGMEEDLPEAKEDDRKEEEGAKTGTKVSNKEHDPEKDSRKETLQDNRGENHDGHPGGLEEVMVPDQELTLSS